jgi:hypothetical protein
MIKITYIAKEIALGGAKGTTPLGRKSSHLKKSSKSTVKIHNIFFENRSWSMLYCVQPVNPKNARHVTLHEHYPGRDRSYDFPATGSFEDNFLVDRNY